MITVLGFKYFTCNEAELKSFRSFRILFYLCSLMYDSEVMCRQKVDTPWSIYRDFTVRLFLDLLIGLIYWTSMVFWARLFWESRAWVRAAMEKQ